MKKRINAFIIGILAVQLVWLPIQPAFGQSDEPIQSSSDSIYRVFSDYQDYPVTTGELEDAATAIEAGLSPVGAFQPAPDPIREYTAMMSDIWGVLFTSSYQNTTSGLYFGEWLSTTSGVLAGDNESGETINIDVLLSIELPPSETIGFDDADILLLESGNVRYGSALIEMSTDLGMVRTSCGWLEMKGDDGQVVTKVFPLSVVTDQSWSRLSDIMLIAGDAFDNVWAESPASVGNPWSRFKGKLAAAGRKWNRSVGRAFVGAAIVAATALAVGASPVLVAVVAAVLIVRVVMNASDQFNADVQKAIDELRTETEPDITWNDPDLLTDEQIIGIAEEIYR